MLLAIERDKAKEIVKDYYSHLNAFGYTKHTVVDRYLFWLFILYFVERVYGLMSESDYNLVNKALIKLFSSGDCLMSYKLARNTTGTVGEPIYMGKFYVRITEENSWRATEQSRLRGYDGNKE